MQSKSRIQPRTLKGFRDYLPEVMIPRERLMDTARAVYRSYGYSPIDTPALEYLEILAGKGGEETDKQLYKFQDSGGRWVGLRFDLTVPLARFAAQYITELGTPLKRYHIAPVWRGENPQRGRYREFVQCDFDTIGTESVVADIESVLVVHDLMLAVGFQQFTIHVNNRRVLSGLLQRHGLSEQSSAVLRALDKLPKIGRQRVADEMQHAAGASEQQANEVLRLAEIEGPVDDVLRRLRPLVEGNATAEQGAGELEQLAAAVRAVGVPESRLKIDLSIARGLDYYTGTIFETFLDALPTIGSVCSGGRYDNLAELYTSRRLPGVGGSLGLDRLLAAMEELGMIEPVRTTAPVFIAYFDKDRLDTYLQLAALLRRAGIGCEMYPEPKALGKQLKYADRQGFRVAVIAGSRELDAGLCQVKHLATGSKHEVSLGDQGRPLIDAIRGLLVDEEATENQPV